MVHTADVGMVEKIFEIYEGEIDIRGEITAIATTTAVIVVVMFVITATTATAATSGSIGAIGIA